MLAIAGNLNNDNILYYENYERKWTKKITFLAYSGLVLKKEKAKGKKHNLSLVTPVKAGALRLKSKYDCRNLFSSPDLVWSSYTWR